MQLLQKTLPIVILIFLAWVVPWSLSFADMPEILPVRSVPPVPKEQVQINLPQTFDGGGAIQRIGKDETGRKLIVIGDRLRYFAKGVTFYGRTGDLLAESKFKVGDVVGYDLTEKKEIIKLYMTGE